MTGFLSLETTHVRVVFLYDKRYSLSYALVCKDGHLSTYPALSGALGVPQEFIESRAC
jgi:hypothetical protein